MILYVRIFRKISWCNKILIIKKKTCSTDKKVNILNLKLFSLKHKIQTKLMKFKYKYALLLLKLKDFLGCYQFEDLYQVSFNLNYIKVSGCLAIEFSWFLTEGQNSRKKKNRSV